MRLWLFIFNLCLVGVVDLRADAWLDHLAVLGQTRPHIARELVRYNTADQRLRNESNLSPAEKDQLKQEKQDAMRNIANALNAENSAGNRAAQAQQGDKGGSPPPPLPPPPESKNDKKKEEPKKEETKVADAKEAKGFVAPTPAPEPNKVELTSKKAESGTKAGAEDAKLAKMGKELVEKNELYEALKLTSIYESYLKRVEAMQGRPVGTAKQTAAKPAKQTTAERVLAFNAAVGKDLTSADRLVRVSQYMRNGSAAAVQPKNDTAMAVSIAKYAMDESELSPTISPRPSRAVASEEAVATNASPHEKVVAREQSRKVGHFMRGHSASVVGSTREDRQYTAGHQAVIAQRGAFVTPASLR